MTFVPVHGFSLLSEQSSLSNLKPKNISIRTHQTAANWEWTLFCIMHTNFCRNESIFDYFVSVSLFWVSNELRVERSSDYVIKVTILMSFLSSPFFSLSPARQKLKSTETLPRTKWKKFQGRVFVALFSVSKRKKFALHRMQVNVWCTHSFPLFSTLQIPLSFNIPDDEIAFRVRSIKMSLFSENLTSCKFSWIKCAAENRL